MDNIIYELINKELKNKIEKQYGKMEADHLHFEKNSCSLAAIKNEEVIGFISVYEKELSNPLNDLYDAYIDIIEVKKEFRRKGIAKNLIKHCEEWAKKRGYFQIRAWSSEDKVEAIPMWRNLSYCMCPAKIWVEWCEEVVDGYYVSKKL